VLVPLAFHVDYWDYIGWTDPFSSAEWSDRQRSYGRAFELDTIYTPQLVINGKAHVVGSRERDVRAAIDDAASQPLLVDISLSVDKAQDEILVAVSAEILEDLPIDELTAYVILYETDLETQVSAGENRDSTLRNDHVVRLLEPVFAIAAQESTRQAGVIRFRLEPHWKRSDLGVVAFVQDPESLEIFAAVLR